MVTLIAVAALNLGSSLSRHRGAEQQVAAERRLVAYQTLRRIVGVLGVGLPFVVVIWGFGGRAVPDSRVLLPLPLHQV